MLSILLEAGDMSTNTEESLLSAETRTQEVQEFSLKLFSVGSGFSVTAAEYSQKAGTPSAKAPGC